MDAMITAMFLPNKIEDFRTYKKLFKKTSSKYNKENIKYNYHQSKIRSWFWKQVHNKIILGSHALLPTWLFIISDTYIKLV